MNGLRDFLAQIEKAGQLQTIQGASWDLEISCLTELNVKRKDCPVLLFDPVKTYQPGYRVVTCMYATPYREGLILDLPTNLSTLELLRAIGDHLPVWESRISQFPLRFVADGPVTENVHDGSAVDVLEFPALKFHRLDGGRFMSQGATVVTRDPENGDINLGAYRTMVHDSRTLGLYISPTGHGRLHYQKYHSQGKACPIAVCLGQDPILFAAACLELPTGSEYLFAGSVRQKGIEVIREEVTGLPVPADSEIVLAGWCPPDRTRIEGPVGEWTGYYGSKARPAPIIEIERVYHRNLPILQTNFAMQIPADASFHTNFFRSALALNELRKMGVPDVRGTWFSEEAKGRCIQVVSIKQRYAGHARQAALLASQCRPALRYARYTIVVDEDIDPTDMAQVLWALGTRTVPDADIDIVRRCVSSALDPALRKGERFYFTSRAIIDATKPFEWISEFPETVDIGADLVSRVKANWGQQLKLN